MGRIARGSEVRTCIEVEGCDHGSADFTEVKLDVQKSRSSPRPGWWGTESIADALQPGGERAGVGGRRERELSLHKSGRVVEKSIEELAMQLTYGSSRGHASMTLSTKQSHNPRLSRWFGGSSEERC